MKIVLIVVIIVVAVIGGVSAQMFFKNRKTPEDIGIKNGNLAAVPSSPNAVSSQTDVSEKRVDPLPFKGSLEASKAAVLKVIAEYGGTTVVTNSERYLHIVHETKKMKFRDDLEFYFDETDQKVHFRSASRVGYSDIGLNRTRYDELAENYARQL